VRLAACLIVIGMSLSALAQVSNNNIQFVSGYYNVPYIIAVGDIYGKGAQQPLGTVNDGFGLMSGTTIPGLESLFPGRANRDTRIADLNNDGFPDIISNTYSCVDPVGHPADIARVYLNNKNGTFTEVSSPFRDQQGRPIELRGRGETIVVADFNNDGFLDAFLPYYTFTPQAPPGCANSTQSYLLINDGTGHFTDVAVEAGVDVPNQLPNIEGAQALDFNGDGLIDLYGSAHLFINTGIAANGHPHFVDMGRTFGLPSILDDEGAKFIDWNNDGTLALVSHDTFHGPTAGPDLYTFNGATFTPAPESATEGGSFGRLSLPDVSRVGLPGSFADDGPSSPLPVKLFSPASFSLLSNAFPDDGLPYDCGYGVNAYDLNNDGLDDVIVRDASYVSSTGDCAAPVIPPRIYMNQGLGATPRFVKSPAQFNFGRVPGINACPGGAVGFGDFNNDGKIDVAFCSFFGALIATNTTAVNNANFGVELLGPNGERNQQGRVIKVSPMSAPNVIYTRVVDGGSGYLSQNQYPLLIGSRYNENHIVSVSLPSNFVSGGTATMSFVISPGQKATVFAPSAAYPNGNVKIATLPNHNHFSPALFQAAMGSLE